ncbi:MAG: hypothetical protein AB7Y46_13860 [Armatimonadota bacterium]
MSGCVERPPCDRWPLAPVEVAAPIDEFAWRSPSEPARVETTGGDPLTVAGAITALGASPDLEGSPLGVLVFHEQGVDRFSTLLLDNGPVPISGDLPVVRSALTANYPEDTPPWRVSVLLTGGTTDSPAPAGDAESPPWLMGGEVRVAWFDGDEFAVGESELPADANPWRITAGRFAGEQNLLVFVYNQAPFDRVMRRRPWIYRLVEGPDGRPHLEPRWRGTCFAHPFRDAIFCDLTGSGEGEIAALEVTEDGGRRLTAYRFEGFGLEGIASSVILPQVEDRLEAAFSGSCGSNRNGMQLIVRAVGRSPQFVFYALRDGAEPALAEVARAACPANLLGWVVATEDAFTSDIFCLLRDGSTEWVHVPLGQLGVAE